MTNDSLMTNDYLVKKTYNSFMVISVLSVLAATLGVLIDNVIAGKMLGQDALGAMGIAGPLSLVFTFLSSLCVLGGTVKATQALGQGEKDAPSHYFSVTLVFFTVISLLIGGLGLLFSEQLAVLLGAKDELVEPSTQYLKGFMWSIFPNLVMFSLGNFTKISGANKLPLYAVIAMTVSDVVLDILLVPWGLLGLGLATTFAYSIGLAVNCLYFLDKEHTLHIVRPKRFFSELKSIMPPGLPTGAVRLSEAFRAILLNNLMVITLGAGALAALNVRTQAYNFFGAVILGMGQSLLPVVGLFHGQEARISLRDSLWYSLRTGLVLNIGLCIVLMIFADVIASLFGTLDADVQEMADMSIILLGVSLPLRGVNYTMISYYQATGREALATGLSILQSFVLVCGCAVVLIGPFAATGVWVAFILAEVFTFAVIITYICFYHKRLPGSFDDLMLLQSAYGREKPFIISVRNTVEDVIKAVEAALAYAETKGLDEKKKNAIGIMIEEVGTNIVRHAFDDQKDHWLDVFLFVKGEEVRLHFRDNGKPFDPINYSDTNEPGTGLKLIRGFSKNIQYNYNLILNELDIAI